MRKCIAHSASRIRLPRPLVLAGVLAALAGCANEPYLSFRQGEATLDDQALQLSLQDALGDSKPTRGNRVTLLRDGAQTLPAMFRAMAEARDHINLEYFTFDNIKNPSTNQTLGDFLVDRMARGVQIDIIYDSYGSKDTDNAFLERLRKSGAHLLSFNPGLTTKAGDLANPNDRDHRKVLVIDGKTAFVGGINLDRVYDNRTESPGGGDTSKAIWRDIDAEIEGPAVAELQRLFLETWAKQSGTQLPDRTWFPPLPPQGDQIARIIGSAPGDDQPLYYVSVMTAIHAARRSISASTGYFVPTHQEREELANAARRGVRVRLILPGKSDSQSALAAGRAAYDDLLEVGVEIDEMHDDVLHAKIMVVDGVWTTVGSSNLDRRSVVFNNEVDAIILGAETGRSMEGLLDQERARTTKIDLATWRARPLGEQLDEYITRIWRFLL